MGLTLNTALQGMQQATGTVQKAANNIATAPVYQQQQQEKYDLSSEYDSIDVEDQVALSSDVSEPDMAKEIVHLMEGENAYMANAQVVRTEEEMIGSMLDISV